MASFNQAFLITMKNEGAYSNNPHDSGGETWAGISRNNWPKWAGWAIVDKIKAQKPASLNKVLSADKELSSLVLSFYKHNFWDTEGLDGINSQQVANQLFDAAVNMGTGIASKFLQQAINALKANAVVVDGQIGGKTIAAANALDGPALYNAICTLRKNRYEQIIARDPSQAIFRKSWFSRIKAYEQALS